MNYSNYYLNIFMHSIMWIQNSSNISYKFILSCSMVLLLVLCFAFVFLIFEVITRIVEKVKQSFVGSWNNRHCLLIFILSLLCDLEEVFSLYVYRKFDKTNEKRRKQQQPVQTVDNSIVREKIHRERYRPTLKLLIGSTNSDQFVPVRALLDTGASISCISPRLVDRLQLTKKLFWPEGISCFPGCKSTFLYQNVEIQLKPINSKQTKLETVEPIKLIVDRNGFTACTERAPSNILFNLVQTQFGIKLADDDCNRKSFDLLIGQDFLNSHFLKRKQKSLFLTDELAVIETRFGHVVQGSFDSKKNWSLDQMPSLKEQNILVRDYKEAKDLTKNLTIKVENQFWSSILVLPQKLICFAELMILSIPFISILFMTYLLECIVGLFQSSKPLLPTTLNRRQKSTNYYPTTVFGYVLFKIFNKIRNLFNKHLRLTAFKQLHTSENITFVYMPSLVVNVSNPDINSLQTSSYKTYLKFDSGSPFSFISSTLAKKLECKRIPIEPYTLRTGPPVRIEITDAVRVRFQSVHDLNVVEEVQLLVHPDPNLGRVSIPSPSITQLVTSQFGIELPKHSEPVSHILLGTDILTSKFLLPQQNSIQLLPNLSLIPTRFGWTLNGSRYFNPLSKCHNFWTPTTTKSKMQLFCYQFGEFAIVSMRLFLYWFLYFLFNKIKHDLH